MAKHPPRYDGNPGFPRESGVLLHPTSLPGRYGIGDLGPEAYSFVDLLQRSGQRVWQMLPLGPLGYGGSPYQSLSAFAGNPLLISPAKLLEQNLLDDSDIKSVPDFSESTVDFEAVAAFKRNLLRRSFEIFETGTSSDLKERFETFCSQNAVWLEDFAIFVALRERHGMAPWYTWEEQIRSRAPQAISLWSHLLSFEIRKAKYEQFLFFEQWFALKKYCQQRLIRLIGDIPIFPSLDSDSVWAHPEMFWLDDRGRPLVVAGVPPDYFSKTGQLWNNPLYRWDVMKSDGYKWWIERFRATLRFVDIIRIDHFRGFAQYWEIPAGSANAVEGRWADGPGADLFEKAIEALGPVPIIAEDLGTITPDVFELRDRFNLPGMRVLQFGFMSGLADDLHLPHNFPRNCVAYTGTHDNDTTVGWFSGEADTSTVTPEARLRERKRVLAYTGTDGSAINWDLIRLALMSVANTVVVPLQDILGLGREARMNTPGTATGNWGWRVTPAMIPEDVLLKLKDLTLIYGR